MESLVKKDVRSNAFQQCIRFINYELVQGDILEFGVYSGRSLALLSYYNKQYCQTENHVNRQNVPYRSCYGFDSWEGLPTDIEEHPRWSNGLFKTNHSYHPSIPHNQHIEPKDVDDFFKSVELNNIILVKESYDKLKLPREINQVALVHIDCDLYESTKTVLNLIRWNIVDGTVIMFDDWFNYKGDSKKGEQRAFNEFLFENEHITATEYLQYATFCKAFILHSK